MRDYNLLFIMPQYHFAHPNTPLQSKHNKHIIVSTRVTTAHTFMSPRQQQLVAINWLLKGKLSYEANLLAKRYIEC